MPKNTNKPNAKAPNKPLSKEEEKLRTAQIVGELHSKDREITLKKPKKFDKSTHNQDVPLNKYNSLHIPSKITYNQAVALILNKELGIGGNNMKHKIPLTGVDNSKSAIHNMNTVYDKHGRLTNIEVPNNAEIKFNGKGKNAPAYVEIDNETYLLGIDKKKYQGLQKDIEKNNKQISKEAKLDKESNDLTNTWNALSTPIPDSSDKKTTKNLKAIMAKGRNEVTKKQAKLKKEQAKLKKEHGATKDIVSDINKSKAQNREKYIAAHKGPQKPAAPKGPQGPAPKGPQKPVAQQGTQGPQKPVAQQGTQQRPVAPPPKLPQNMSSQTSTPLKNPKQQQARDAIIKLSETSNIITLPNSVNLNGVEIKQYTAKNFTTTLDPDLIKQADREIFITTNMVEAGTNFKSEHKLSLEYDKKGQLVKINLPENSEIKFAGEGDSALTYAVIEGKAYHLNMTQKKYNELEQYSAEHKPAIALEEKQRQNIDAKKEKPQEKGEQKPKDAKSEELTPPKNPAPKQPEPPKNPAPSPQTGSKQPEQPILGTKPAAPSKPVPPIPPKTQKPPVPPRPTKPLPTPPSHSLPPTPPPKEVPEQPLSEAAKVNPNSKDQEAPLPEPQPTSETAPTQTQQTALANEISTEHLPPPLEDLDTRGPPAQSTLETAQKQPVPASPSKPKPPIPQQQQPSTLETAPPQTQPAAALDNEATGPLPPPLDPEIEGQQQSMPPPEPILPAGAAPEQPTLRAETTPGSIPDPILPAGTAPEQPTLRAETTPGPIPDPILPAGTAPEQPTLRAETTPGSIPDPILPAGTAPEQPTLRAETTPGPIPDPILPAGTAPEQPTLRAETTPGPIPDPILPAGTAPEQAVPSEPKTAPPPVPTAQKPQPPSRAAPEQAVPSEPKTAPPPVPTAQKPPVPTGPKPEVPRAHTQVPQTQLNQPASNPTTPPESSPMTPGQNQENKGAGASKVGEKPLSGINSDTDPIKKQNRIMKMVNTMRNKLTKRTETAKGTRTALPVTSKSKDQAKDQSNVPGGH